MTLKADTRILVPGGRIACVVGDVCISRKQGGRHYVLPLSADIQVRARKIGFDNLTPIRWLKVANIKVKPLPEGISLKFVDPAKLLDESEKWEKLYASIIASQAR